MAPLATHEQTEVCEYFAFNTRNTEHLLHTLALPDLAPPGDLGLSTVLAQDHFYSVSCCLHLT
mgnify:CR=1 FL=1